MLSLILLTLIQSKLAESLIKLPLVIDNQILITGQAIRETVNTLFSNLKLSKLKGKSRLDGYIILHKYFISKTLQDYNVLNEIASLTRVNYKNTNNNISFIDTINELIDESVNNTNEKFNKDDIVILHIEYFLNKLNSLKDQYSGVNVTINEEVFKHLRNLNTHNSSKFKSQTIDDDDAILSGNEFWEPSARRVYKGKRSRIRDYPFMASVHMFDTFYCAGSIIATDLILTASSCLQLAYNNRLFRENPAFLSVNIGSSFYKGGGESIAVLEVYFYPSYNPKTLRHNICILRLTRHIKFRRSRKVRRIQLDQYASSLPINTDGITIVGWGAKEFGNAGLSDPWRSILSYAVLDIYPYRDCQDIYGKEYVNRENFCAGFISRGGGACNRDVGGPGIVSRKLTGIISFGSPVCGSPDTPTVFTKVGYYLDWIENIMEQDVPTGRKRTTLKPASAFTWRTPSPPPTTFKIPPIEGNPEPISILDIESKSLRDFDDTLFKEFLNTMFNAKEINKHNQLIRILEGNETDEEEYNSIQTEIVQTTTRTTKANEEVMMTAPPMEEIEMDTDIEMNTVEPEIIEHATEFNLSQLIKDEDLVKIIKEEILGTNLTDDAVNLQVDDRDFDVFGSSDIERNNLNNKEHIKKVDDVGLSIPSKSFMDFTRTKNTTNETLPDNEFYRILSEVMFEQIQNKSYVV